ncbi:MAG: DUF305 domain-containing protein [Paracoccus sp. (in: a-proteobacteria)]|uniref:DUF305 domain-containing protein n=1 Tax=Paracoccus sp. TaxID=267 RepID=UPI0039E70BB8
MKSVTIPLFTALLAMPALAQHAGHAGHGDDSMAAYMATMEPMMGSMQGMASTGDADADFLLMMIPHHQSALDMAQVELAQGDDPETRALAERIIEAQKAEIAQMKAMLERLGHPMPE